MRPRPSSRPSSRSPFCLRINLRLRLDTPVSGFGLIGVALGLILGPLGAPPGRRGSCRRAPSTSPNFRHWPSAQSPGASTFSNHLVLVLGFNLRLGLHPRTQLWFSEHLVLVPDLSSCHCFTFLHCLYSPATAPWSMHPCHAPARLQRGPGYNRLPLGLGKPSSHPSF